MTIEEEVGAAFAGGCPPSLAEIGGTGFLRGREAAVALTVWMPDILRLVAMALKWDGDPALADFVVACAEAPVGPDQVAASDYVEAMQTLAAAALPPAVASRCQSALVRRLTAPDEHEVARWAALGAALQIGLVHPSLRHRLLDALLHLPVDGGSPEFLRRVAKAVGVVHSHWPDASLRELLERLTEEPVARDEAFFELGMASLHQGLDAVAPRDVDRFVDDARGHFDAARAAREHRSDVAAYTEALGLLVAMRRGDPGDALRGRADAVRREAMTTSAWGGPEGAAWPWMGARWAELVRWHELASRLGEIDGVGDAVAQADAEVSVRRSLLEIYVANRAILDRGHGGVETFVQPRLEARLLRDEVAAEAAAAWLEDEARSPGSEWRDAAAELLARIRSGGPPAGKRAGAANQA